MEFINNYTDCNAILWHLSFTQGIIHMIQEIFSNWGVDRNSNLMLLVCMAFCVLIAWLLHLAIEKPFMKLRDRFIQQKIVLKKNKLVKNYN